METRDLQRRAERFVRRHSLIRAGGEVTVLLSGGADSTCLWHVLGELGYAVSALHVNHGLRGAESEEDARFCRERFDAEIVDGRGGRNEDDWRRIRYSFASDRLRATAHTASDQVETVLYRLVSSGRPGGIKPTREDGVVRPLLEVRRDETRAYCEAVGLPYRDDTSNPDTKRGLIRNELLPLLRRLDPRAEANLLALASDDEPRLPRKLEEGLRSLLAETHGTKHADLPGGFHATRVADRLVVARGGARWGPWVIDGTEDVVAVPGIVEDARVRAVRSEDT